MRFMDIGRCTAIALVIFFGTASAEPLPAPEQKPILTISGRINTTNAGDTAVFDRASLEALGTVSFTTKTPWYKEPVTFEGVPLARLLARVGAEGDTIVATALNDYASEIPMEDAQTRKVILALKRDGRYLPVSDKGPLFIVYDFDHDPEAQKPKYYQRSVWQVARLRVE